MTREKFIRKWLGNKEYQYTEESRNLMRDDLDAVIEANKISFNSVLADSSFCDCKDRSSFYRDKEDNDICYDCDLPLAK
jgi:hypothetical protein